jgi:class 3 adenylate cyclase
MSELPTGVVTFLLTDIEGYAYLWEQQATAMQAAQERYHLLLGHYVEEHAGVVRSPDTSDSRLAVFARATDAVASAAALQTALVAEPWPTVAPLQVRMALHTGEADTVDGTYSGLAFVRGVHLRDVAHSGQIVLSRATYDLVRDYYAQDTVGLAFVDLGEHRLRDLTRPEHIFQHGEPAPIFTRQTGAVGAGQL